MWLRDTFRYEPLSFDLVQVSRPEEAGKKALREVAPIARYRLATQKNDPPPAGLPVGISLDPIGDVDFRHVLSTKRDGAPRPIYLTDANVTVREIVNANENQNWDSNNSKLWKKVVVALSTGNDLLDFNAQTTLASSYGLLQGMYTVVQQKARWRDPYGPGQSDAHPKYLVDTPMNLANGDGSLNVSTVQLLYLLGLASDGSLKKDYDIDPFPIDHFESMTQFAEGWQVGVTLYNYGKDGYAEGVMSAADSFKPLNPNTGIQKGSK